MAARSRFVAAMTRTSTRSVRVLPRRSNSPCSSTRSSFACSSSGRSPISSRKIVDPSATSNRPLCRARAPVYAPRSRPNSSASIRLGGRAAQLTFIITRPRRALRPWMLQASNSLPGRVRRGHLLDLNQHPLDGLALSDDATARARGHVDLLAEVQVLLFQPRLELPHLGQRLLEADPVVPARQGTSEYLTQQAEPGNHLGRPHPFVSEAGD